MKNKIKFLLTVLITLAVAVMLTACGNADDSKLQLSEMETIEYNNPQNGASITIPADWQVKSEDENCTVFANADGTISLVLKWELGGMSYFSEEELAGLAADVCKATLGEGAEVYKSLELTKFDVAVKAVFCGEADGVNAVCDTAIIQYYNDVRYYLTAVTDAGTYSQYEDAFTQIANSFTCTLTEDEVYQKMNERNLAKAEAEAEAETENQE